MDIVHAGQMQWVQPRSGHRGTDKDKKPAPEKTDGGWKWLFKGDPDSMDNYHLVMLKRGGTEQRNPRHRHNHDQIRFMLKGRNNYAPKDTVPEGTITYIADGTPYGPQMGTGDDTLILGWQGAGVDPVEFLTLEKIREAGRELREEGEFVEGIFRRKSGKGPKNQDGYEAIWERVTGKKIKYANPRYDRPIHMHPDNFNWVRLDEGIAIKRLGTYTERGTTLYMLRLEAGTSHQFEESDSRRLVFSIDGEGIVGGETYEQYSAVRLEKGEGVNLTADRVTELFIIDMPPQPVPVDVDAESPAVEAAE